VVVVVQTGAGGGGQVDPGVHTSAEPEQVVAVDVRHTMSDAQSVSTLQPPGTHALVTVGTHSGAEGQFSPGGHFGVGGQAPSDVTWQLKPC
jgi:hypothetical protein